MKNNRTYITIIKLCLIQLCICLTLTISGCGGNKSHPKEKSPSSEKKAGVTTSGNIEKKKDKSEKEISSSDKTVNNGSGETIPNPLLSDIAGSENGIKINGITGDINSDTSNNVNINNNSNNSSNYNSNNGEGSNANSGNSNNNGGSNNSGSNNNGDSNNSGSTHPAGHGNTDSPATSKINPGSGMATTNPSTGTASTDTQPASDNHVTTPPATQAPTTAPPQINNINVTMEIKCNLILNNPDLTTTASIPSDGYFLKSTGYTTAENSTVFDVFEKACASSDIQYVYSGSASRNNVYISSIAGLTQKECGKYSGWKYRVNGIAPSVGASMYKLKDGDVISWYYAINITD